VFIPFLECKKELVKSQIFSTFKPQKINFENRNAIQFSKSFFRKPYGKRLVNKNRQKQEFNLK